MPARLISIIGPPAVGKTTLAQRLAQALPARLVREDYAGNPFLAEFFLGRKDYALPAQMYFLFSRLGQLHRGSWPEAGWVVSDYGFCQDAVYAHRSLSGQNLEFYQALAGQAGALVKEPDVLIHLDGGEPALLERIAGRGRPFEKAFTFEFLADLRGTYAELAAGASCPVITIDTGKVDIRQEPALQELLGRLAKLGHDARR